MNTHLKFHGELCVDLSGKLLFAITFINCEMTTDDQKDGTKYVEYSLTGRTINNEYLFIPIRFHLKTEIPRKYGFAVFRVAVKFKIIKKEKR